MDHGWEHCTGVGFGVSEQKPVCEENRRAQSPALQPIFRVLFLHKDQGQASCSAHTRRHPLASRGTEMWQRGIKVKEPCFGKF